MKNRKSMKLRILPVIGLFLSLSFQSFSQEMIHYWHFNAASGIQDEVPADVFSGGEAPVLVYQKIDPNGPEIGIMDDVGGSNINAQPGFEAGRGIRPRNPSFNGELYIQLNSEGFENLQLSYATERSGQGMLKQVFYVSTDGENFFPFGDTIDIETDYHLVELDFSSLPGADNNPDFSLKIRFLEQNTADNGNNRFDNILLVGDPLFETAIVHYWHLNNVSGVLDTVFADYFNGLHPSYLLYRKIDPNGDDIGIMDDVGGSAINARNNYEAGRGIRPRNPSLNGELFISLNSEGFEDLLLSYATERSGQGMLKQVLYYTTDGENFTPFGDTFEVATSYQLAAFDFSSIPEVNDNPNFGVLIRFLDQNTADNGNNRFDNIVLEATPKDAVVEGVVINEKDVRIVVGSEFEFSATILPLNANNQNVSWRSLNEEVAVIDESGRADGLRAGSTHIVVTTEDGGFEDSSLLTVLQIYELEVLVTDGTQPLEDVELILGGEAQHTNASGIAGFSITADKYDLKASKSGFLPYFREVLIESDTSIKIELNQIPGTLLHYWHFNGIPVGTIDLVDADYTIIEDSRPVIYYDFLPDYVENPDMTIGYMDDYVNGSILNVQLGQPAGAALRVRNRSEGRALIIEIPTTGAKNISLVFDVYRSGQGMLINHFEYSIDGTNFQNVDLYPVSVDIPEEYATQTIDLTGVEGANDNPNFAIRITYEGNTDQGNGNNRYDNIAVFGDLVSSIPSIQTGESIRIFPNPSSGSVKIEGNGNLSNETGTFYLFSLDGKLIKSGEFQSGKILRFEDLPRGPYTILLDWRGEQFQERLILH
ncbi:MAG: hypothetical protein EA409_04730 [Saprospirales bacterium]|nr:MAG: hypothetical protein EA409_04730 [Saprospirales bacterium]